MSEMQREVTIEREQIEYDRELDGVRISDEVFLPRRVVVWAFEELKKAERRTLKIPEPSRPDLKPKGE